MQSGGGLRAGRSRDRGGALRLPERRLTIWVFTLDGFYSAVADPADPDRLVVRARDREDAERLARKLDLDGPVIETPERDYRYRLFVPRHSWGLYLYGTGADIEYGNFKAAVEERHGISRELLYSRVWSVMLSLQPRLWPKLRKQLMPRSRSPWADDPLFDGLDAYGNEPPFDDLDLDTYAEPVFDRGPAVPLPDESWDDPPRKRRRARRRRR